MMVIPTSRPASAVVRRLVRLCLVMALPSPLAGQAAIEAPDTVVPAAQSGDARDAARAAQARFEVRRARLVPRSLGGGSAPCDEIVGRLCTWYGDGNWVPEAEPRGIVTLRAALLDTLDVLQRAAPGDGWILGQRVWYRAEGGDWAGALDVARACGPPQEPWWCAALTGLALHGLDRWPEAERAFEVALWEMDVERAWRWRVPRRAVDGDGRRLLDDLRLTTTDSVAALVDRMWGLADPLHLVDGNDRKTAHFARWTVATLREGARTPYGFSWGDDLEELMVRTGWAMGWERETDVWRTGPDRVISHDHPAGRDYLPSGQVLEDPGAATPEDFVAGRTRPRSLYTPPYAPEVLPMEVQVAVFPRDRGFLVVAGHDLPPDTTRRAREGIPRPWMEPGDQEDLPDRSGLHVLDASTGAVLARATSNEARGVLWVESTAGRRVLSVESWSPRLKRAGRHRVGIELKPVPEDIPVLSDLLLVDTGGRGEPVTLMDALPRALVRPRIEAGALVGVAWEVTGLGFRREVLAFALSVERVDRGIFQRIGGWLGVSGPDRPLSLAWEEPGPDAPGALFRHVVLELPDLEPGRYAARLRLGTTGRDPVVVERVFEVLPPGGPR